MLTQFYYREFTWDPQVDQTTLQDRAHRKFFTPDVAPQLTEDLLFLRDFNQAHYPLFTGIGLLGPLRQPSLAAAVDQVWNDQTYFPDKEYWLNRLADEVRKLQTMAEGGGDMVRIGEIESRIAAARPLTCQRSEATLDLMQQAIDDIRAHLASDPDVDEADYTLYRIDVYIAEYLGLPPPPPPFAIIRPSSVQDGHVYVHGGTVVNTSPFGLWGKYEGEGIHPVGIHSLPANVGAADVSWAKLRIPQTDNIWTVNESCLSLDMRLKHIDAADDLMVTPTDGTSTPLADLGLYRAGAPYVVDNSRFVQLYVTEHVRADLLAGRWSFAWRIEPESIPDSVSSQRYLPTVDSTDPAFGDHNQGARLFLKIVEGRCADAVDNDGDGDIDCDDSDCADTPVCRPGHPDFDGDGDVDQEDFGHLQACLTAWVFDPITPGCEGADLDRDNHVDQDDFGIFEGCLSGANVPYAPGCAD